MLRTKKEQCERFGFKLGMLNKLVFENQIEYVKIGTKVYIKDEAIQSYINSRTVQVKG